MTLDNKCIFCYTVITMKQIINTYNIPDTISLTDLRYKTSFLLRKLEEEKPLILIKKSKRLALIFPLTSDIGRKKVENGLKIKPYPLGTPKRIKRSLLYDKYLEKKVGK